MIDRNKVPSNTVTLTPQDFDHAKSTSLADSLLQRVPSVYINDTSGNPFQPDVQYRGFVASPTVGVPQGLAVYQNGVRINESFGDTVNWDFIPEYAIRRLDVFPNNPVFGLNALGGAISIEMKNGFNYQGREIELLGGSNWRRSAMAQVGMQQGNIVVLRCRRRAQRQRLARPFAVGIAPRVCGRGRARRRQPSSTSISPAPPTSSAPPRRPRSRC